MKCLSETKPLPNVMHKESQPNPTAPVPAEMPAFPPHVQLLNGPVLAAGKSNYSGMNIHDLMCLHKIYKCIYKMYKHIKHNKHFRDCFVPFSNTESENTAHVAAKKQS